MGLVDKIRQTHSRENPRGVSFLIPLGFCVGVLAGFLFVLDIAGNFRALLAFPGAVGYCWALLGIAEYCLISPGIIAMF